MKGLVAVALLALAASAPARADQAVKVHKILTTTRTTIGQPLTLPSHDPQVIVTTYEIAPGAKLPRHMHPFPRYAYVLAGDLTVTYEGNRVRHYHTGDFIIEAIKVWHSAVNSGGTPVKLLVIDQVEAGKPNTILAK